MAYTVKETLVKSTEYDLNTLLMKDWPIQALNDAYTVMTIPKHLAFMQDRSKSLAERKAYLIKLIETQNTILSL